MRFFIVFFVVLLSVSFGCQGNNGGRLDEFPKAVELKDTTIFKKDSTALDNSNRVEFSHALHMNIDGLDCTICHKGSNQPELSFGVCVECHENGLSTESEDENMNRVHSYRPSEPINFPHALHMELDGMDCTTCHANRGTEKVKSSICVQCHSE